MVNLTWKIARKIVLAYAAVTAVETAALVAYVHFYFPSSISFEIASAALEKLIDADAALLGFTGVIVAVTMQKSRYQAMRSLIFSIPVVGLLLASMIACFGGLVAGNPVSNLAFYYPLAFLVLGTTILFVGVGIITLTG
jgi:hypothetical protein